MGGAKSVNIKSYRRKRQINIGIVLFFVVFVYLIVTMIIYATGKKITAYEVREGSILDDRFYTGIALRNEKVIPARASGYINYLQSEYSKLSTGMGAYVVTPRPLSYPETFDGAKEGISGEKQQKLTGLIQDFNENYSPGNFSYVYTFKNEVSDFLLEAFDRTKTSKIEDILKKSGMSAGVYDAPCDGIMLHYADGYEDLTFDSFKASDLDDESYEATFIRDNGAIKEGRPAYKLIVGEKWEIIVKLDEKTAAKLIKVPKVDTRINKDKEIMRADLSIYEKNGEIYGRLKYNDSMIRWAGMRFLNVEIILEDIKGLKIPKSSLTRQDFYVIPKGYLKKEKDGYGLGVYLQKEDGELKFTPVRIYKATEDDKIFIGKKGIPPDSVLIRPDSTEKTQIKESESLTGVFNLNKGYAEFKRVDILCESGDYCIVEPGDVYGLHNYDHIAQDAAEASEGEIIF